MASGKKKASGKYTCNEYREEMVLLALQHQLRQPDLSDKKRAALLKEITRLEKELGF